MEEDEIDRSKNGQKNFHSIFIYFYGHFFLLPQIGCDTGEIFFNHWVVSEFCGRLIEWVSRDFTGRLNTFLIASILDTDKDQSL